MFWRRPGPFGAQHKRDARRPERLFEIHLRFAGKPDAPEAGFADLLERAREVDHPRPRHALQRARRRFGERAAFGRRMAVLGDDPDGSERRRRAQDRADIVRVGDLVENQEQGALAGVAEDIAKPDVFKRLDFDDHPLVRRIVRDQPAEVGHVGERYRNLLREAHEPGAFARRPGLEYAPQGIVERRGDRMLAPQARAVCRSVVLVRSLVAGHARQMEQAGEAGNAGF